MFTDENAQAAGSYFLGFMCMSINTTQDLGDLNSLLRENRSEMSTFLHEYIHFLQNFTSTSGLYSSGHYAQFVKYAVHQLLNIKESSIKLPLRVDDTHNRIAIENLNKIYRGDSKVIRRVKYNATFPTQETISTADGQSVSPFKYVVNLTCYETRREINYHFGATALKEFVAHSIQNRFLNVEHPDAPYLLVDLILRVELPNFTDENLKIILCDASLMAFHPADIFFYSIEKISNAGEQYPRNPVDFYDFLLNDISFDGPQGKFDDKDALFLHMVREVENDYNSLFGSDIFKGELQWIKHILSESRKLRTNNPTFLLNLIDDNGNFTSDFMSIFKNLGTPIFLNAKFDCNLVPPDSFKDSTPLQPYVLLAASVVLSQIYETNARCYMYDFCKKSNESKDLTDDNCKKNPFLKMNDSELCPFGQLTKTWGLSALDLQR